MNLNPFTNIRKWARKDFPDIDSKWIRRKIAEEETDRDLQKPVQQLLCDVHEESLAPLPEKSPGETDENFNQRMAVAQLQRLIGAQKRMVSLQTVNAFESSRASIWLFWLTLVVIVETLFLIYMAIFPRQTSIANSSPPVHLTNTSTNR